MEKHSISFSQIAPFVRYVQKLEIVPETYPTYSDVLPYDCRIFYVVSGKGTLRIEGESRRLERGQAMLWLSGVRYHIKSDENDPLVLLGANFDYTQSLSTLTVPVPPDPVTSFEHGRKWESVEFVDFPKLNRPVHLNNMQILQEPLQEMLIEYKAQKLFCARMLSSMMLNILVVLARNIALTDSDRNTSAAKMDSVLDYIHERYTQELDNDQLGAHFGYHPNYLNRQIKLYTGKTMHQYLIHYRIARAIDLLVSTDKPVGEIAICVGFKDVCHFSKIFKLKTGLSPYALRSGDTKIYL